jgi:GTP-binding nuclear protein Ran
MNKSFKIVIAGDKQTGKSTYLGKLLNGKFKATYSPTLGVEVKPINFTTITKDTLETVTLNIWDTAGDDEYGGLRDGYYVMADAAILFLGDDDKRNRYFYELLKKYTQTIVVCKSKVDVDIVKVPSNFPDAISLSSLSSFNLYKPIVELLKEILKVDQLELV